MSEGGGSNCSTTITQDLDNMDLLNDEPSVEVGISDVEIWINAIVYQLQNEKCKSDFINNFINTTIDRLGATSLKLKLEATTYWNKKKGKPLLPLLIDIQNVCTLYI